MWYACSSDITPKTKSVCTLSFDDRDLLRKHLSANTIHYAGFGSQYDVFNDDGLQYSIDIGTIPLQRTKGVGAIIGIGIIVIVIALLVLFTFRFILS